MAKEKFVRLPGGKELTFPASMSDHEVRMQVLDQILGPMPSLDFGPEPKKEAGFTGGFGEGITTLGGLPETLGYLVSPTAERRKAAAEAGESEYEYQRAKDIEGLGGLTRFVREQAGSSLGSIATPLAASAAAARFTPTPLKPFAATGAFLTAAGAQYLTNEATRHAGVQEARVKEGKAAEMPDVTKMLLTSAGQAGLDIAGFRLFRPLGELVGLAGRENAKKVEKEIAEAFAKDPIEGTKKVLGKKSIAAGMATGAAFEAAQEIAQQALERYGVGLDLASDEAIQEYFESAIGGGLLGGPLGGVSTYAGNVRKGVYNKDFLKQTADAIQGKKINIGQEWDNYSKQIYVDAPSFDLTDDQGNFLPYTPNLLERLGIDPTSKAINIGGRERVTIPMEDILKANTGDETIGNSLLRLFRYDRTKLGEEIKNDAKQLEPEELAAKVKEYETLTAAVKTYEAFFNPKQSINSPSNFVVQQSPTDPKKFIVFNPVTGRNVANQNFVSAENAQKYIDGKIEQDKKGQGGPEVLLPADLEIQSDPVKPGVFTVFNKKTGKYDTKREFKTKEDAENYVKGRVGTFKPATPAAPTPPAGPTPEEIAARQAQDARAQLYTDLAARYPNNPDAVKEITAMAEDLEATMSPTDALAQAETTYLQDQEAAAPKATVTDITPKIEAKQDAELEAGILEDEAQRGRAALTPEVNKEIEEALALAKQAMVKDPRSAGFFEQDKTFAEEFAASVNNVYEGLEKGTLPYAVQTVENLRTQANNLKQTFQQRIADREAYKGSTYFAPEAFENVNQEHKSRSKIVKMSPDDFLRMVPPNSFVKTKLENVNKLIEEDKKFSNLPYLITQEDPETGKAKVIGVEGQHRATALKEMGVTSMPVHIRSSIRWSEQDNPESNDYWKGQWPTELEAEEGTKTIPYPVPDIRVAPTPAPAKPKAPRTRKKPTGQPYEKYTAQMREMMAGIDPESGLAEDLNEFVNMAEEAKDTTIAKELSQLAAAYAQASKDSTNPKLSQGEQDSALQRASNIFETLKDVRERITPQNAADMKAAKDATGNADTGNKVAAKVTKDVCG